MEPITITLSDLECHWLFLNFSNSYSSMNMTHINYVMCIHEWKKYILSLIATGFQKMKDFSRLGPLHVQAVAYTVKVAVSKKWCKIDTLILKR